MSALDPTEALLKMAEALGLNSADLAALAERVGGDTPVVTVADLIADVRGACSEKSLPTYNKHFRALVTNFGDQPVAAITANHLCALRDETIARAAAEKIERAERNGRALRTYERADVPGLVKAAQKALALHPESLAPTKPGAEITKRILSNLSQVAVGIAELRNQCTDRTMAARRPSSVSGLGMRTLRSGPRLRTAGCCLRRLSRGGRARRGNTV